MYNYVVNYLYKNVFILIVSFFLINHVCFAGNSLWKLVVDAKPIKTSKGYYPSAKYYIDILTVEKSESIISFQLKQELEKPLSNGAKVVVTHTFIDCLLNTFKFGELLAYDINNKLIGKESSNVSHSIPEEAPGYGKTPLANVRDFICDNSGLNNDTKEISNDQSDIDKEYEELTKNFLNKYKEYIKKYLKRKEWKQKDWESLKLVLKLMPRKLLRLLNRKLKKGKTVSWPR